MLLLSAVTQVTCRRGLGEVLDKEEALCGIEVLRGLAEQHCNLSSRGIERLLGIELRPEVRVREEVQIVQVSLTGRLELAADVNIPWK